MVPVVTALLERLGLPTDARALIISCDDLGLSQATNPGVLSALHDGVATCASLMVPAPWAHHAAQLVSATDDIGVHLTLIAEHESYRWGPITPAPSLLSGGGGFPSSLADRWEQADPDEVRRELRAQVTRAMAWGVDVTHLAPHLSTITLRPEFFDIYIELAVEYVLPIRLPSTIDSSQAGFPFRELASAEGVVFPDHFDHDWRPGSRQRVLDAIATLQPGVTEIHIQPAHDTPEIRAMSAAAPGWIDDLKFATSDDLRRTLEDAGVVMLGFRELRAVMRDG